VLPRSFPWEFDPPAPKEDEKKDNAKEESLAPPPKLTKFGLSVAASVVLVIVMATLWILGLYTAAAVTTLAGAILIFLIGVLPRDAGQTDVTDEVVDEISEGNVRAEILKEVLFLMVPVVTAALFHMIPLELPQSAWLSRVFGSLLGLLVGGGIVWLIRIGGSLGFNKQAMGIGDVHLMAGVGAVIGGPLVLFAFFMAPFAGILWALVLKILGKPNVLPYGPWLSVASIMALLVGNPIIKAWLP